MAEVTVHPQVVMRDGETWAVLPMEMAAGDVDKVVSEMRNVLGTSDGFISMPLAGGDWLIVRRDDVVRVEFQVLT